MPTEIVIRRATSDENSAVHDLVQAIADETFAYLFATPQVPIGEANWFSAWLAILGEEIVGVTMTREEWVSDLWVRSDSAGVESAQSYWRMRNVKYAVVDMTHSDFGWSSRMLGLYSSITGKAGGFTANFRMRNSGTQCWK